MHEEGLLLHLHKNFKDLFPKGVAYDDAGDCDPPSHDELERRGTALGQAPEQKKEAVVVSRKGPVSTDEI